MSLLLTIPTYYMFDELTRRAQEASNHTRQSRAERQKRLEEARRLAEKRTEDIRKAKEAAGASSLKEGQVRHGQTRWPLPSVHPPSRLFFVAPDTGAGGAVVHRL